MNPDITVSELTKTFTNADRTIVALENIDFMVGRGQLFCIVGPSGCGKSTLLRLLLGLIKPTSGSFAIDPGRESRRCVRSAEFAPAALENLTAECCPRERA
jgi:ABC-type sugar transport system ATPase subunit